MRVLLTLTLFFLCGSCLVAEQLSLSVAAEEAILINAKTGAILFEKNAHKQAFPASITKIATALYALHVRGDQLDRLVTVTPQAVASITPSAKKQSNYRSPPHWIETDSDHIGLKNGEEIPLRDLFYALLVSSANDAANVIAFHVGGKMARFMESMNEYLEEIGCQNTRFLNPHGLHHPQHATTVYDMALIAKEGMKDPVFRQIVSTVRYTCPPTNLEEKRTFVQTNLLLRNGAYTYPKATGVKTGTTQAAGKTLVASAEDKGRELIAVVMGERGNERYSDVVKMFNAAFSEPKLRRQLLSKGAKPITLPVRGSRGKLKTLLQNGLAYEFYPSEELPVKTLVKWDLPPLPISKGSKVGVMRVVDTSGAILAEEPLIAAETLNRSIFLKSLVIIGLGIFALAVAFFLFKRSGRRSRPLF